MKYYSTRDKQRLNPFCLKDAAFLGLAPDGGLFMPERYPNIDLETLRLKASSSFADMASYVIGLLFGEDVPMPDLDSLVRDAYDFPLPLAEVGPGLHTLELFHGPTFAFKDFGARFMGRMMGLLGGTAEPVIVLTATSGDTGSAVAQGFYGVQGVSVIVLYPDGKVSDLQEAQMTTLGKNIYPVRVSGNFDDCQRLVKEMFSDNSLRAEARITSANSINILRWMPQSLYYFYGWCLWAEGKDDSALKEGCTIVVPSGNYGNITAGMLAWKMGLPVKGFVCGANANDVVPSFLSSGDYKPRTSVQTVANAMDVGAPSNFERLLYLFDDDKEAVRSSLKGFSYSDSMIEAAIGEMYKNFGYVSDPHSAVGYLAYKDARIPDGQGFWMSTANPAKFLPVVKRSTGYEPELPEAFKEICKKKRVSMPMEADGEALRRYILSFR